MIRTNDLIVQQTYPEDEKSWYVHEVALLDLGRFRTEREAVEHRAFLLEKKYNN
jgi:hypothetical protein